MISVHAAAVADQDLVPAIVLALAVFLVIKVVLDLILTECHAQEM